jgi:predicted permease
VSELRRSGERVRALWQKAALDAELEAEMQVHLEMAIEENIARGMTADEARRAALVEFGGVTQARELQRETRGLMTLDIVMADIRYTLRTLRKDAGFTVVAVLILALAIGANVAVFSVVNTILLRPLPFYKADQLVWVAPPPQKCGLSCATYSTDAYDEFRVNSRSYQDVTGYFAFSSPGNLSLSTGGGAPIPATGIDVIANFFQVLGVQPAIGRAFTADDGRDGAAPVVLLTDAWWRTQFGADKSIVGKAIDLNGKQTTVIGVLPRTFDFGAVFSPGLKVDAITPLDLYGPPRNWGNIITMIGRLKAGISMGQAVGDAKRVLPTMCWNNKNPETCGTEYTEIQPVPLKDYVSGRLRQSLVVLWAAVGAILLIACVNLSNLLLARAAARGKEFAMRGALGASRGRIVAQLLTESVILSGTGAVLGLGLAVVLLTWLAHQGAIALPLLSQVRVNGASLGWTVLIALFAAVLFGVVPGLRVAGGNLQEALKDSSASSGQGRKHERVRSVLVVTEVALACALLVGAGLLLRSFLKVLDVDLGYQPARAASIKVEYDASAPTQDESAAKLRMIFQGVLSRVSALPGVEAAGISDYLPLGPNRAWGTPLPKGKYGPNDHPHFPTPLVYVVTPGYFRAMGMRVQGQDFGWDDGLKTPIRVLINKSAAQAYWPGESAIGKVLVNGDEEKHVIGVVDDIHAESTENETGWQIYYSAMQKNPSGAELVVRTRMKPAALATSVLTVLREINPKQPAAEFKPVQMLVDHANSPRRFFMMLVGSFAGLGLLLAALGIYGVISYSVTRQTQEIGIRMALGSSAGRVQRLVIGSTLRLALIGIALGCVASVAVGKLIGSLLFGMTAWDGVTYVAMALGMVAVAALSGYVPARRASRISPLVALRAE